jgi:hypothetical protein
VKEEGVAWGSHERPRVVVQQSNNSEVHFGGSLSDDELVNYRAETGPRHAETDAAMLADSRPVRDHAARACDRARRGAALCVLSLLLFVPARLASSDACIKQTFITPAHGTPISMEAGVGDFRTWLKAMRNHTSTYLPHQLVPLTVSGATPCGGLLANWTVHLRVRSQDAPTFKQASASKKGARTKKYF